jgi:hypothetical protein
MQIFNYQWDDSAKEILTGESMILFISTLNISARPTCSNCTKQQTGYGSKMVGVIIIGWRKRISNSSPMA